MPKLKPGTIFPTAEEAEVINRGVEADPDTYELSDAEFAQLKPGRGRPRGSVAQIRKVPLNMRVDAEVLERFRASGPGWQSRINVVLADWLKTHSPEELPG
jgi:uncharacterized protein (DUF4415 family)